MISQEEKLSSFIENFESLKDQLESASPLWLQKIRQENLERFYKIGFPSIREEEFKYTNISPIIERRYIYKTSPTSIDRKRLNNYLNDEDINLVFIDGTFSKELSNLKSIPQGLQVLTLTEALIKQEALLKDSWTKQNMVNEPAFSCLNKALSDTGVLVHVEKKFNIDRLIHIVNINQSSGSIFFNRNVVLLSDSSKVNILESHISLNDESIYFNNTLTEIFVSENACLNYYKAEKESIKGYHVGHTRILQDRNSTAQSFTICVGSAIARNNLDIILNQEGASVRLNGLYCVDGKQHVDNQTSVDHRFPNCTSNQLYKGILNGSARAIFNGKIFVRPIAQQTNSYQLNKNLLLGKDCRVDTKPQLEIFADDVKCTHGATIGQLNEDEIFYLCSRSISKKIARRLLAIGFVTDILDTIENQSVRSKFIQLLEPTFAKL